MAVVEIPRLSLVVLVGASGSGKSTFAARHFKPTEVLSSDRFRGIVADDESAMDATGDAFELLHLAARQRLQRGLLTVVDATNVQKTARAPLVALAREQNVLPVAIVLDVPELICHERNGKRPDRAFGSHVVRSQRRQLRQSLRDLPREGFRHVHVLRSPEEIEGTEIVRQPLWNDRRDEHGPFDIIGDVHGCADELTELLSRLGWDIERGTAADGGAAYRVRHPDGRKAVFVGDLVDRGPAVPSVLRLAMDMVQDGAALCVPGNHDEKLLRKLRGRDVKLAHGLELSVAQLEREPAGFGARVEAFLDALVSHYVLDDGRLVVAHAGLPAAMHGRASGRVREFALYGETTGEADEYGLPVRYPWAQEYRGKALVVYGHTPVPDAEWLNNTICVDTGCVFGGCLTALRYPERELVSVPARAIHYQPARPFPALAPPAPELTAQQQMDDLLDLGDVMGKRAVQTRLQGTVMVHADNAAAALEAMSRFAVNPKWLVYLPPTMSPPETSTLPDHLEHPEQAFEYYRTRGVARVVCEEKHMGSRAVLVVCRDESVARRRFGVTGEGAGICYTRTGRRFFDAPELHEGLLQRVRAACDAGGLWDELRTDWVCLDAELMPWSVKAQQLIRSQYAAVGTAAGAALAEGREALRMATAAGRDTATLLARIEERADAVERYTAAYSRYCWDVLSIDDLRLAPFHILASEGYVHVDRDHLWHMKLAQRLAAAGAPPFPTRFQEVDTTDPASRAAGVAFWQALTAAAGEGFVVKPTEYLARGPKGLVQPALKCRGPEYLRIIYGPEYLLPANLERLRARSLRAKRALALRELALGVEGLERFVHREPLRRVHECVFAVLALESEPVDPRL